MSKPIRYERQNEMQPIGVVASRLIGKIAVAYVAQSPDPSTPKAGPQARSTE